MDDGQMTGSFRNMMEQAARQWEWTKRLIRDPAEQAIEEAYNPFEDIIPVGAVHKLLGRIVGRAAKAAIPRVTSPVVRYALQRTPEEEELAKMGVRIGKSDLPRTLHGLPKQRPWDTPSAQQPGIYSTAETGGKKVVPPSYRPEKVKTYELPEAAEDPVEFLKRQWPARQAGAPGAGASGQVVGPAARDVGQGQGVPISGTPLRVLGATDETVEQSKELLRAGWERLPERLKATILHQKEPVKVLLPETMFGALGMYYPTTKLVSVSRTSLLENPYTQQTTLPHELTHRAADIAGRLWKDTAGVKLHPSTDAMYRAPGSARPNKYVRGEALAYLASGDRDRLLAPGRDPEMVKLALRHLEKQFPPSIAPPPFMARARQAQQARQRFLRSERMLPESEPPLPRYTSPPPLQVEAVPPMTLPNAAPLTSEEVTRLTPSPKQMEEAKALFSRVWESLPERLKAGLWKDRPMVGVELDYKPFERTVRLHAPDISIPAERLGSRRTASQLQHDLYRTLMGEHDWRTIAQALSTREPSKVRAALETLERALPPSLAPRPPELQRAIIERARRRLGRPSID